MNRQKNLMYLGLGCGFTLIIAIGAIVASVVWISSVPEGGVRLKNDMEEYALEYIESQAILGPGEDLIAYYDFTLSLDSSDAAILTTSRIIHHKQGRNGFLYLADVEDIRHRTEFLTGDIFEIYSGSGESLKLEIDPLNGGETFKTALMRAWKTAREEGKNGSRTVDTREGPGASGETRLEPGEELRKAVESWIEYLPDDNAMEEIGKLGRPAELVLFERWTQSRDRHLAVALGRLKARSVVPGFVEYLMDDSQESLSRGDAALALGMIGDMSAVPPLINLLDHDDPEMKLHAIRSLGRLRSSEAVPRLIEMLEDPVPSIRTQAAWNLASIRDRRAVNPMLALLPKSIDRDKCNLVRALGVIGDKKAVDAAVELTRDGESYSVRLSAVMALGALAEENAVPRLVEVLESEEGDLQFHAADSLGSIGSDLAVPALVAALEKANPTTSGAITNALKKLTGQDLGSGYGAWKNWLDKRR
ncbi:MAG: HEAT repeat domain-containing protein [Planctomycetota bacterium]